MQKLLLLLLIIMSFGFAGAQVNKAVVKLVADGILLHDKGDYDGAIKKYDEALNIDKNDYDANYEKSFSCLMAKRYDECISISKFILEKLPANINKLGVYVNYGSALDYKDESEKAIDIYNEGIKKYPDHYLLFFNKALTLTRINKPGEALSNFQKALGVNPLHTSSNYYTGVILQHSNKIPALLATLVFLAIEPVSERSNDAFERVQQIMYGNIKYYLKKNWKRNR